MSDADSGTDGLRPQNNTIIDACLAQFGILVSKLEDRHHQRSILASHLTRFQLWVHRFGAYLTSGALSRGYRAHPNLKTHLINLLEGLHGTLIEGAEGSDTSAVEVDLDDPTIIELAEYFQEDSATDSVVDRVIKDIGNVINCLLRLSTTMSLTQYNRNSPTNKTDIYDSVHVTATFPRMRVGLRSRLVRAMGWRHQHFGHGERYSSQIYPFEGLTGDSEGMGSQQGTRDAWRPSPPANAALQELGVPPLPQEHRAGPFKCPFCQLIIAIETESAWKNHVFQDLQSYLCLTEDCPMAMERYSRRSDWIEHMKVEHWMVWSCPFTCSGFFPEPEMLRQHVLDIHGDDVSPDNTAYLVGLSGHTDDFKAQSCPLCGDFRISSSQQYDSHVGGHLESLALFALAKRGPVANDTSLESIDFVSSLAEPGTIRTDMNRPTDDNRRGMIWSCHLCGADFGSSRSLTRHLEEVHG